MIFNILFHFFLIFSTLKTKRRRYFSVSLQSFEGKKKFTYILGDRNLIKNLCNWCYQTMVRERSKTKVDAWLSDDSNSVVTCFIWHEMQTKYKTIFQCLRCYEDDHHIKNAFGVFFSRWFWLKSSLYIYWQFVNQFKVITKRHS